MTSGGKLADRPADELLVQRDKVFALHGGIVQQPRRLPLGSVDLDEQLRRFRGCPPGDAGNHGQDHVVQPLIVPVALDDQGRAFLAPRAVAIRQVGQNDFAASDVHVCPRCES